METIDNHCYLSGNNIIRSSILLLNKYCVFLLLLFSGVVMAEPLQVVIGVLSHRGDEATLKHWNPTADYLTQTVPDATFVIKPLAFDRIDEAIASRQVDFLLVNPGIYVAMEVRHRISRIATLNNLVNEESLNIFGGVIFTRKNNDIETLSDLRDHSFMGVDESSLGGFQMAWRELQQAEIDPYSDFSSLTFGGTHDAVVRAVLDGTVDAGTVRTGILASMALDDEVDLDDVRILNRRYSDSFPLIHSTRLYPEWPFSKLQHTSNVLAQRVAVALLKMFELDPAAQWGDYAGWTVPLDYQPVHDLLKDLALPPYDQARHFTLMDVIARYWIWMAVVAAFMLLLAVMTTWVNRLNRELDKSRHLLMQQNTQILDSVADGIYGVDLQGNATFVNKAMEKMTGWKSEDMLGKNQHEIMHHTREDGSYFPKEECPVALTFIDNQPRYIEEDLFWKKDGTPLPVEYSSNPIRDSKGITVGSVVVFRDISFKKKVEEERRQYELERSHVIRLSTMGEMASGLAHELNQPLTAIAANADACIRLFEAGRTERIGEALHKISLQAHHAGEIIRQLRRFVNKGQLEHEAVNINELIEEVLILVLPDIRKAGINLKKYLDRDLPDVFIQHIQIDQVFLNLVRNAIDAMQARKNVQHELTITTCLDDDMVITRIQDTGEGISSEIREKLFTPFVTTKKQGMGLGLSLSMNILSAHKGKLYLGDTSPEGSTFCFSLPVFKGKKSHV